MIKKSINPETQECSVTPTQMPQTVSIHAPVSPSSIKNETGSIGKNASLLQTMDAIRTSGQYELEFKKIEPKFSESL